MCSCKENLKTWQTEAMGLIGLKLSLADYWMDLRYAWV